ncbi:DUF1850 domain-containing protein [Melaminivora jejuensis]|uniref:DUF1850 domain-containing protein n=1 Tax=Melaminivora jejuensis TaxID=1267217 RepID=UPI001ADFB3F0|nr:DUF1850 domain-containing protein [Melaminivora jejuensis]UHJ65809.1 DUF1850 domain-containing protein [Melaminivora jejuensis]
MTVLGICLALAAAPAASIFVPAERFTLAWTHSIEKVRWEEDYAVLPGPPATLRALQARVRGSAAGMEPPPDARLDGGWYRYQPPAQPATPLLLTRSEFTADFELCLAGRCRPMGHWLASDGAITRLSPCSAPAGAP